MRVYISADIEGVTDVTSWEETERGGIGYERAAEQMTAEVAAACRGAFSAGVDEIVVKDAHDSAMNLIHKDLPRDVKLFRGWADTPEAMMAGVGNGFDLVFLIGYHSEGGSNANPLAHTMTYSKLMVTRINGKRIAEMDLNAMIAASHQVPVALVTGDKGICSKAEIVLPGVVTVAVKEGIGGATVSMHPLDACDAIEKQARIAVENCKEGRCAPLSLPSRFELEFVFKEHMAAKSASNYEGASLTDEHTVRLKADSFQEMLTAYSFMH